MTEQEQSTNTDQSQPITWADIQKYEYVVFPENTSTQVVVCNWVLLKKEELDFSDKTKRVIKKYLMCDVFELNGKPCKMMLRTSSINLIAALKPILEPRQTNDKVKVAVVRTGTATKTRYVCTEIQ